MGQGVRTVLGQNFCSRLRVPNCVARPFSNSEIWLLQFFKEVLYVLFLRINALWSNCSSKEINFYCSEMVFVHCQLKACLLDAFGSCSQVGEEVISIIGCNADVVTILGSLVRFNDFAEVFFHEARKCGQHPAKALCQTSVSECATSEINDPHFK